jgi:hypothetical protein
LAFAKHGDALAAVAKGQEAAGVAPGGLPPFGGEQGDQSQGWRD